jgi:hypothetical protein
MHRKVSVYSCLIFGMVDKITRIAFKIWEKIKWLETVVTKITFIIKLVAY